MKQQNNKISQNIDKKPKNRNLFVLKNGIVIDSMFPSGNVGYAKNVYSNSNMIQISGNPDHANDQYARYWLYFRMKGYKQNDKILFFLKNANYLRKFINKQKTVLRPKIVYKIQDTSWKTIQQDLQIQLLEDDKIDARFQFCVSDTSRTQQQKLIRFNNNQDLNETCMSMVERQKVEISQIYIAINYPYSEEDLNKYLNSVKQGYQVRYSEILSLYINNCGNVIKEQLSDQRKNLVYFNEETLIYSVERRKISLITMTSLGNVESFCERENKIDQNLFPYPKDRPFKLKKKPIIFFSGRVHPSQVSSSFFLEGIIDFLLQENNQISKLLLIPMINVDGVSNGNYRHDNNLKNLNRQYGLGSFQQTPQIKAIQILLNHYKNHPVSTTVSQVKNVNKEIQGQNVKTQNFLMFYFDVHSHQSAKPSFLFGNFNQSIDSRIQNRLFCKLIQKNMGKHCFRQSECNFDKQNLNIKEKYDQNTKHHTGRAYSGFKLENKSSNRTTFHSYTLEINSYLLNSQFRKMSQNIKDTDENKKERQVQNLIDFSKKLAEQILKSISILVGYSSLNEEKKQMSQLRLSYCKQLNKQVTKLRKTLIDIKTSQKHLQQLKSITKSLEQNQKQYIQKLYTIKIQKQPTSQVKKCVNKKLSRSITIKNDIIRQSSISKEIENKQIPQQEGEEKQKSSKKKIELNFQLLKENQSGVKSTKNKDSSSKRSNKKQKDTSVEFINRKQLFKSLKRHKQYSIDQQLKNQIIQKIQKTNTNPNNYKINKIVIGNDNSLCLQGSEDIEEMAINNSSIIHCIKNQRHKKPKMRIRTEGRDYVEQEVLSEYNTTIFIDNFRNLGQRLSYNNNTSKSIGQGSQSISNNSIGNPNYLLQNVIQYKKRIKQLTDKKPISQSSSSISNSIDYEKAKYLNNITQSVDQDSKKYRMSYQIRQMSKYINKIREQNQSNKIIQSNNQLQKFPDINIKSLKRESQRHEIMKNQIFDRNKLIEKNKYCSIQAIRETIKKRRLELIDVQKLKKGSIKSDSNNKQFAIKVSQLKKLSHSPSPHMFKDDKLINFFIRKQGNQK